MSKSFEKFGFKAYFFVYSARICDKLICFLIFSDHERPNEANFVILCLQKLREKTKIQEQKQH